MAGLGALHRHHFWDGALAVTAITLLSAAGAAGAAALAGTAGPAQIAAGIACFICALLVAYGALIEPQSISVRRARIVGTRLPSMRIAVIADFHVGPLKSEKFLRRIVERCNALQPDMILLPGDFLYDATSSPAPLAELGKLHAPLGVFATIGNHDSGSYIDFHHHPFFTEDHSVDVETALTHAGITVLRNASTTVQHGRTSIMIAGVEDIWSQRYAKAPAFLDSLDKELPTILVSHHPDPALAPETRGIDLAVSGHTHGGQLRLPILGPILPIPSALGRRYDSGLFRIPQGPQLFITHGVGEAILRARFLAPPEIVLLEISAA